MELSNEQMEMIKARDVRIRALDTSLLVQQELRTSKSLNLIMAALQDDVDDAMNEFADVNPGDMLTISALQARVHRLVYFRRTLAMIQQAGDAAAAALQAAAETTE